MTGRDVMILVDQLKEAERKLEELRRTILLDCQPKSQEDAVYVSIKWRDWVLTLANGPVTPNLKRTPR